MIKLINIEGMSCGHCVKHVEEALKEVTGVSKVTVDIKSKNAIVELTDDVSELELKNAIEDAGYDVVSVVNL